MLECLCVFISCCLYHEPFSLLSRPAPFSIVRVVDDVLLHDILGVRDVVELPAINPSGLHKMVVSHLIKMILHINLAPHQHGILAEL
mmetsp:Transcript_19692/g.32507  ORF Transcript_19692/g.32507 Transcript_19692/m.32507 type:complete len:87 (-) Transcript_19692:859-1119(-)